MEMWVDDWRTPPESGDVPVIWVKTYREAIELLKTGQVQSASLDHDLGTWMTGYNVVCWMEENNVWPEHGVAVHSQNPVGRERMEAVIKRAYGQRDERRAAGIPETVPDGPGITLGGEAVDTTHD